MRLFAKSTAVDLAQRTKVAKQWYKRFGNLKLGKKWPVQ